MEFLEQLHWNKMKALNPFLLLLLLLGIDCFRGLQFHCQLPAFAHCYIEKHWRIRCASITFKPFCLELEDVETQEQAFRLRSRIFRISFCPHGQWNTLRFTIEEGLLTHRGKEIPLHGILEKKHHRYRGLLRFQHSGIWIQDFIPLKRFLPLIIPQDASKNAPSIDIGSLQLYGTQNKQHLCVCYQCQKLNTGDLSLQNITGNSFLQNQQILSYFHASEARYKDIKTDACLSFKTTLNDLKNHTFHDVFLRASGRFFQWHNGEFFAHMAHLNPARYESFAAEYSMPGGRFQGTGILRFDTQRWYVTRGRGRVTPGWLAKNFAQGSFLYPFLCTRPLFVMGRGNVHTWQLQFHTTHLALNGEPYNHIHSKVAYQDRTDTFHWRMELDSLSGPLNIRGRYDRKDQSGRLLCQGYMAPRITYPLKAWLPRWWHSFFSQFIFHDKLPRTDFDLQWHRQNHQLFGSTHIQQGTYKHTDLKDLNVIFGHQPGYFFLNIAPLTTPSGQGHCTIHWPYRPKNAQERWVFEGEGTYAIRDWETILADFLGRKEKWALLHLFQKDSVANLRFHGKYSLRTMEDDFLHLLAYSDRTECDHLPVTNLKFYYQWNPQGTKLYTKQSLLFGRAPIDLTWHLRGNAFSLQFEGKDIPTGPVLQHPFFEKWVAAIPAHNLQSYEGDLDLTLQCEGEKKQPLRVSGTGHIDFRNPNLSSIHILGPLSTLIARGTRLNPAIQLDQVVSDFSFTEDEISLQQTQLLGPSTRADAVGTIGLKTQQLDANIHFSFLDFDRLKIPIMRHLMQVFRPISKGFSASVHGSFAAPQWTTRFNPLRFVFPDSPKHRKNSRK